MTKTELIIFDLDGTLVDSEKVYHEGWSHVLKGYWHNVDATEFEMMRGRSTELNNQMIKTYLGSDELVKEARNLREEYYFAALEKNEVELKRGAAELIKGAHDKGFKLAVATSSYSKRGLDTLKQFDLLKYFDYRVFGDEVINPKPHPEIYNKVLDLAGVSFENAVAIEDSSSGLESALAAKLGVYFVPEVEVDLQGVEGEFDVFPSLIEVKRELLGE